MFDVNTEQFDTGQADIIYLKRRVQDEAAAAADATSITATLIHVALASRYAERCCDAEDQAWVAEHRVW